MKKTLLLTFATLFTLVLAVDAQPGGGLPSPDEMAKRETEQMRSGLNLTADQLPNVEAINLKYARKMGEMFQAGPPADFSEMQQKMEVIQKTKRVDLEKVLTADQLKKYDQMMEERMKNGPGGPPR